MKLLSQLLKFSSVLYHGSPTLGLKVIEPKPSRVTEDVPYVFATPDKGLAISFLSRWGDSDFTKTRETLNLRIKLWKRNK